MNKNQPELVRMLNFATRQLAPSEQADYQQHLKHNRKLAKQLARVKDIYEQLRGKRAAPASKLSFASDDELPAAESIAAFVEGTLSKGEADSIEAMCQESDYLLMEVISCHRHVTRHQNHIHNGSARKNSSAITSGLVDQMTTLVAEELKLQIPAKEKQASAELENNDETSSRIGLMERQDAPNDRIDRSESRKLEKSLRSQVTAWKLVAGLSSLVAAAAVFVAFSSVGSNSNPNDQQPGHHGLASQKNETNPTDKPPVTAGDGEPTDRLESFANESPNDKLGAPLKPPHNNPGEFVENAGQPDAFESEETPKPLIGRKPFGHPPSVPGKLVNTTTPVFPSWQQPIRGVIVGRKHTRNQSEIWAGGLSQNHEHHNQFQVLHDGWAAADISGIGRITLPANSIVRMFRDIENDSVVLLVERGAFAISEIPSGTRFRVGRSGKGELEIESLREGSCIAVTRKSNLLETLGVAGLVRAKRIHKLEAFSTNIDLSRYPALAELKPMYRQQWTFDGKLEKINSVEKPKWLRRPKRASQLPKELSQTLLTATDIVSELNVIKAKKLQPFKVRGLLAVQPDQAWRFLNSTDRDERQAAADWIFDIPANTPQIRAVSNSLKSNGVSEDINRMMRFAVYRASRMDYDVAMKLVTNLNHPVVGERQLSFGIMGRVISDWPTGIRYSVDDAPAKRAIAVQKWTHHIDNLARTPGSCINKPRSNSPSNGRDSRSFNDNARN